MGMGMGMGGTDQIGQVRWDSMQQAVSRPSSSWHPPDRYAS